MSTPPPWLRDRLELPLDDEISLSSSSGSPSSPSHPPSGGAAGNKSQSNPLATSAAIAVPGLTTKIETEFPATNSSPKMKHVNVMDRGTRSLERSRGSIQPLLYAVGPTRGSTGSVRKSKTRQSSDMLAMNQLSEQAWLKLEAQVKSQKSGGRQPAGKGATSSEGVANSSTQGSSSASSQTPSPSAADGKSVDSASQNGKGKTGQGMGHSGEDRLKTGAGKTNSAGKAPHVSPLFSKVKLRRKGSSGGRDSSQSPHRPAVRNSMPPSMSFHSQYYYDYSDEDSDSRPVSRVYSCASTVSLNELLDTSAEGDFALDDDFFSDWSSMCLSPQHRLTIPSSSSSLHPSPPGQASPATQGQGVQPSPHTTVSSPGGLFHRLLSQGQGPYSKAGAGQAVGLGVKGEREDSGCEVEPSHSDRSESSQCNSQAGGEASETDTRRHSYRADAVMSVEQGAIVRVSGDFEKAVDNAGRDSSSSKGARHEKPACPSPSAKQDSDSAAVVCTVSVASKTVTTVQLPSPQAAVLLEQPSWSRSDSDHSPSSESSSAVSPACSPAGVTSSSTLTGGTSPEHLSTSSSLKSSATDMPSTANPITSVRNHDAFSCTPKLKSKPLSEEERSRACRPDQLILAPADKTVHGFTSSSSSSCDDKSPFKQLPGESHVQCARTASEVRPFETPSGMSKPKKSPPPVPHKPSKPVLGASRLTSLTRVETSSTSASSSSGINSDAVSVSTGGNEGGSASVSSSFPPETTLTVGFMSVEPQQLDHVARNPDTVRDFVNSLVKDMKERVARNSDWPITNSASSATTTTNTTNTLSYCKSLDSSFESLRAERSGSKDDGYSTMSSDIHPIAMEKYSYLDSTVSKTTTDVTSGVKKVSDAVLDHGQVDSQKKRNKSIETSETDSAMETSAHSMDTRNSSHSLSSQVIMILA